MIYLNIAKRIKDTSEELLHRDITGLSPLSLYTVSLINCGLIVFLNNSDFFHENN